MDIRWLGEADCHNPLEVGPKAAHCSKLKENFNVPPGFCITAVELSPNGDDEEHISLNEAQMRELAENYHKLGKLLGKENPSVAVRSSAVDEDNPNSSFAGQHDTYLNVIGEPMLFECVIKCWESAKHEFVMAYRKQHNLNMDKVHIAVLIQALVPSDISAVAFSMDPIHKDYSKIVINGNFGLGKSIVDGIVNPDNFIVDKEDPNHIIKVEPHKKEVMTILQESGTEERKIPSFLQIKPSFTEKQITEVAKMMVELEKVQGYPVDVELAYYKDQLYLLQCRPISTLGVH